MTAYTAGQIFDGGQFVAHHAVLVQQGVIAGIVPASELPADVQTVDYGDAVIAPAFIDIQIYGAAGRLLSVYPQADSLHHLHAYCYNGGAHNCLPTVATSSYPVIYKCIDAVRAYWNEGGQGVLGLHIEGPWINVARRGAHVEEYIHAPTMQQALELLEYGKDVIRMITLAPEVCDPAIVQLIQSHGVIVSAGHSNATFEQATQAFDAGIGAATHLFNAMSPLHHRQPGMVGAIMHHPAVRCSMVPDGYHVDYAAIAIAKKAMGHRLFMITDAVTTTTDGPYQHHLAGDKYEAGGILSGSALTMLQGVQNCVLHAGINTAEALRMASLYPAQVLNMHHQLGMIKKGYTAHMLALNNQLGIVAHIQ